MRIQYLPEADGQKTVSSFDLPDSIFLDDQKIAKVDTPYKPKRFPGYRPKDRYADPFSTGRTKAPLFYDLQNTIQQDIQLVPDSGGNKYIITEKIGDLDYRAPTILEADDFFELQRRQDRLNTWHELSGGKSEGTATQSSRNLVPRIPVESEFFQRVFGGDFIEFRPTGFVNLDFSIQSQRVANPLVPIRQQRATSFLFDPHANINITGQVGEKLQIAGAFDTKASFQFENNFKLEYTGFEEDIIQKIEFGNVSFPLSSSLIQGSQNLFGVTTELKFGRLRISSVFANQRARSQSIDLQGGAQKREFEIAAADYEENRHYFLGQFFRNRYEQTLQTLPQVNSSIQITRMEVYVTNRNSNTQDLRNIVAYQDLGEPTPFNESLTPNPRVRGSANGSNNLFGRVDGIRDVDNAIRQLEGLSLVNGTDFVLLRSARKLSPSEYNFNRELGYISLLTPLKNDEALAVAFEYTFEGETFQVGELTEDIPNQDASEIIHLKMLQLNNRSRALALPIWDLMMKNIYSLNAGQINQQNFLLRIIYKDDLTGIDNPTLQEGLNVQNIPLLRVFGLDELNQLNDPQPDGNFDYVEGYTIDSRNGRIIFPVLEPFGSDLAEEFIPEQEQDLISKFVFNELYEETKADALQAVDKNKFFLKGSFEGTASSNVSLPGLNISPGSVIVMAGNIPLRENVDYSVDYTTGQVELFPPYDTRDDVTIEFEQADLFNFQTRRLFGTRLDYEVNDHLVIGGTLLNLSERPVITRTSTGTEPVNNTLLGFDVNYQSPSRFLTRLTDALPLIQTKEESNITISGEYAQLFPGASRLSGEVSYIDDFEGARTTFNLTRAPQRNWKLGSTPRVLGGPVEDLFNASENGLENGFNRARIAWYNIDNSFYLNNPAADANSHYERRVPPQEIFPNFSPGTLQTFETTLDLAYYPSERGPYNYNPTVDPINGSLPSPRNNFGAITRAITSDVDFDNANVEYIEFWLLDPFIQGENGRIVTNRDNTNNTTGGTLYIDLGDISEDVIPDGRHNFENGLPIDGDLARAEASPPWGVAPAQQFITPNFDNTSDGARDNQDVGLEGLDDAAEASFAPFQTFVNRLANDSLRQDISADNFQYFLDFDTSATILERYKRFNGLEGNSPITGTGGQATSASTNSPDNEDLNVDNTVSEIEAFHQYEIPITPDQLRIGVNPYIIDQVTTTPDIPGFEEPVNWYLFRVPIRDPNRRSTSNIDGFKSIRFIRMFLTDFQQPVVLRMARLQLVASQWRRFLGSLTENITETTTDPETTFNISVVNIEENGSLAQDGQGRPLEIPYRLPPGVIRDRDVTTINNRQLNEQSIQLETRDLADGKAQAIFKNYNLDLLSYKRLRMYIHAQQFDQINRVRDGEMTAFVRLGTDFNDNYYEIEVPLRITPRTDDPAAIWPLENEIDIAFSDLTQTKTLRNLERQNQQGLARVTTPFSRIFERGGNLGRYRLTVVGNPDLSSVQVAMIGLRNPRNPEELGLATNNDGGSPKSVRIWVNELRITEFDQTAGWATVGRANFQLADFADVSASVRYTTFGFGGIDQRISERARETTLEYDVAANLKLDKFLPEELGLKIPMFVSYARRNVKPRFNPLDPDVELATSLNNFSDLEDRNNFQSLVEENTTRSSINFTGIRKERTNPDAKVQFWDIENFSLSYAWSQERSSSITTANYLSRTKRYSLAYNFSKDREFIRPFAKIKFLQLPILNLIGEFNFNPLPNQVTIQADLDRQFNRTILRSADLSTEGVIPLFQKRFLFNRTYGLQWQLSESLSMNYNATTNAVIDEPEEEIDTQEERDSIWNNFLSFGRIKLFQQQLAFNYRVPINKVPLLDWITSDVNYTSGFQWTAGAIARRPGELGQRDTLGNVISNTRQQGLRAGFDLSKLYAKWGFLRRIETGEAPPPPPPPTDSTEAEEPRKRLSEYKAIQAVVKVLLLVKRVNFTYSINESTILPGFRPIPNFFGMQDNFGAPGAKFALFGSQDPNIRQRAIEGDEESRWLVNNAFLQPFTQTRAENINITADLEPIKDLKIQLDARLTRQANYQEFFRLDTRDTLLNGEPNPTFGETTTQNPNRFGSYTVSHIALLTAFRRDNNLNESETFEQFALNRVIIRNRLRNRIQNSDRAGILDDGNYSLNSPDVIIPAFLAAYTGQDADNIKTTSFPKIPLPNWRVDYAGFTKIEALKDVFTTFNISHSYSANYSVNNYRTNLQYGEEFVNLNQDERDDILTSLLNSEDNDPFVIEDGIIAPVFVITQVAISERFAPLIGINMRTKSNLTLRFDYNRDRSLSLNLSNASVAESRNQSFVVSVGFIKQNLKLPIKSQGKFVVLKNDVDFRLDMTVRDSKTIQRQLADPGGAFDLSTTNTVTGGNLNFQMRPTVNYEVNQQLSFQFFYEYTLNNPRTSGSFRRTTTTAGFQLRYNIVQ